MEHVMRQCLIALRLGERLGMNEADRGVLYYSSLIAWVGCHIDAYEQAKWFGDDQALKRNQRLVDPVGVSGVRTFVGQTASTRRSSAGTARARASSRARPSTPPPGW